MSAVLTSRAPNIWSLPKTFDKRRKFKKAILKFENVKNLLTQPLCSLPPLSSELDYPDDVAVHLQIGPDSTRLPWNNNLLPPAGFQCSSSQQFPDSAQPSPHPGCLQSWWPDHSGGQAVFKSYAEKRNYGESDKHFYLATSNPTNSSSSMYVIWWVQWEVVVEDMIHLGV